LEKKATLDFFLVFPNKSTPHVDIYEAVNKISNSICGVEIMLGDLQVSEILE
jgi:hypothetical protein